MATTAPPDPRLPRPLPERRARVEWPFHYASVLPRAPRSAGSAPISGPPIGWRQQRLLILGYHGLSLKDEHEWSGLFITPAFFRARLEVLARLRYQVLRSDGDNSAS